MIGYPLVGGGVVGVCHRNRRLFRCSSLKGICCRFLVVMLGECAVCIGMFAESRIMRSNMMISFECFMFMRVLPPG